MADRFFVNVGARAVVPAIPGLDQVAYMTNTSLMDLGTLPRHLVIIGGGPIALEFGQMDRRFGNLQSRRAAATAYRTRG